MTSPRPRLQLVHNSPAEQRWAWFCGRCGAAWPGEDPPPPSARVCSSCAWGLLLETQLDMLPRPHDAFLVVDRSLLVQGLSRSAERLLTLEEELAVNRPVTELLAGADAETGLGALAAAIVHVLSGGEGPPALFVRPWNTFGIRLRARIGACGPPRAALVLLQVPVAPLRPVAG